MANRMSMYSVSSEMLAGGGSRTTGPQAAQLSTTTLLNAVHNIYLQSQPYRLDSGTSLVVNTWLTAAGDPASGAGGPTIDVALAARVWEHARRRAEDGCIILASTHNSTPSILAPFLNSFPISLPSSLNTALNVVRPFIRCITPYNPSASLQSALGVTLTLNLAGNVTGAKLALSQGGIDTARGLLAVPREPGHRAFDIFYYLLTSASTPAEREFLGLKNASAYALLSRSGTYEPPSYLPTADDAAAADDFRAALKELGIKGSTHRSLISTLAGLLKLGNTLDYGLESEALEETIEDVSGLLGIEPETLLQRCSTEDRATFVGGLYEALVDWVIRRVNDAIDSQMGRIRDGVESLDGSSSPGSESGDTVCITVLEVPDPVLGKALTMRGIFDDSMGINAEMIQDGLDVSPPASSVVREMQTAVAEVSAELGHSNGLRERERSHELEKREIVLEKIGLAADQDSFLKKLLFPVKGEGISLGQAGRIDLSVLLSSSRAWYHLSLHPTDDTPGSLAALPSVTSAWSAGAVSRQLRAFRLAEWANRRNKQLDFTADFDFDEFVRRFAPLGCQDGRDGIEAWSLERGWSSGAVVVGNERVWMRENAWWEAEGVLDMSPVGLSGKGTVGPSAAGAAVAPATGYSASGSGFFSPPTLGGGNQTPNSSSDHLVTHNRGFSQGNGSTLTLGGPGLQGLQQHGSSTALMSMNGGTSGDYGLGRKGDRHQDQMLFNEDGEFAGALDAEKAAGKRIVTKKVDTARRVWVWFVWALTFWIPSPLLRWVGRMKRPDVRMAWREKVVLVFLILLINGFMLFWIIAFGQLLCPNSDKAWTVTEVNSHQGETDFWVSIRGGVYDISKFWRVDHSDSATMPADQASMQPLAGLNLDEYFVPPLVQSCPGLEITDRTQLLVNRSATPEFPQAVHTSGFYSRDPQSALAIPDWYYAKFTPKIKEFYKGDLVWKLGQVEADGRDNQHMWVRYANRIYDLTNLFYTQTQQRNIATYEFLNNKIQTIIAQNPGQDVTGLIDDAIAGANSTERVNMQNSMNCIKNHFFVGIPDFRDEPNCQVNNWILLAFTIILCTVIVIKFLSALQFGSKRRPAPQDKFVICQVPAYTEGEDSLRKALDSLTALQYDNKRKLICVICDGVIVGQGNDRPTPKIVLDILGVDPKVDPPALPFKSVAPGSDQLNYGKVYSGLYEYEGNVVPYMVVVKVGKESEQAKSKPGNRGKRDSQILLMSFLNRVHHRGPMNPLELEMFHQINNVIGVDPELYEYLLMVDADTCVEEDSLNRLVAACANDAKISGICGETSLQNDEKSWWTMIQVYEYFISHHMAKAFESLFGSVTCLPGCFSMYRLRTVDKGKPLIISEGVIKDYSICDVDTLHKKNLLSLGEDRYLTTLMTKHFPYMSNKFVAAAQCKTAAPESWSVLLSQRRRWINSTIHNLAELMRLEEMCGFCCFSMRFVVFVDLFGTIILPATCVYLGWLIYRIASHTGQFPFISLIMIAAVYGLQALVFILKRQWQHIGWMIIYMVAFPIYSFVLPIYSFWNQDNFSWGNTRIVIGEKGDKQVVAVEDDGGFDPRSIPLQCWDDYALANGLPGRRGNGAGMYDRSPDFPPENLDPFDKDESRSIYSTGPQGSYRRSTAYMPPPPSQSPAFGHSLSRQSTLGGAGPYGAESSPMMAAHRQSTVSMGRAAATASPSPFQDLSGSRHPSMANLRGAHNTSPGLSVTGSPAGGLGGGLGNRSSTALSGYGIARPGSSFDFQRAATGPDDGLIVEAIQAVLRDVDLDSVTKKQVRALVEQRLQTELMGEKRAFMDRQIDRELENM